MDPIDFHVNVDNRSSDILSQNEVHTSCSFFFSL